MPRKLVSLALITTLGCAPPAPAQDPTHHIARNVRTSFSPDVLEPRIERGFVHPLASVIGNVEIGDGVFIAPGASVRGDEGQPLHVGAGSNIQDGVVIHALETFDGRHVVDANLVTVAGKRYAVFIGRNVSLAHQSQVHGPASVGDNTFVGMQALIFRAEVGDNCVLEPRALVMGVKISAARYVPAGQVVRTQADADALPAIDDHYPFAHINAGVLHVNHELADGYAASFAEPR